MTDDQLCALDCMLELEAQRRYLVARCLRLEQKIVNLEQERAAGWPRPHVRRHVSADEADHMRELRRRGVPVLSIARRMGWGIDTVYDHTRTVLCERAVGES